MPGQLNVKGSTVTDSTEICHELNQYFCSIGHKMAENIIVTPKQPLSKTFCGTRIQNSIFFETADEYEIIGIINNLNEHKALGVDGIPTKLIKAAKYVLAPYLSKIFNSGLEQGHYYDELKIARVSPLHKGGSKKELKNYRPISILTAFNKIFEIIIKRRLLNFWNKHKVFSPTQFGFRENYSTTLAITHLREYILSELDNKMNICALFVDLAKAFDTVNHKILLYKLSQYGVRGTANNLIKSYLTNRKQQVSGNGVSSSLLDINIGVPQGSVLGPILFLIYINDISSCSNLKTTLYADDSVFTLSHKSVNSLQSSLENELNKLNCWLKVNQLSLNVNKTKFMFFSKSKKNLTLKIDDSEIMQTNCIKYLGVYIDDKLNWYKHIEHIESKLAVAAGVIAKLRKYLPSQALIPIYYSLVYSHLQYAIICWGNCFKKLIHRLQVKQNLIVKIMCNSTCRKINLKPLFKNLQFLKLSGIFELETAKFMLKLHLNKLPDFCGDHLKNFIKVSSIHTYCTRRAISNNYYVPKTFSCNTDRSIKVSGAKIWNNLPNYLKNKISTSSYTSSNILLKQHYLQQQFSL